MTVSKHIGLIGLGVMGRNLALNLRDKGVGVTAWDPWPEAQDWRADGIRVADSLDDFVKALPAPRLIWLMVKAGEPVDDMIALLKPLLAAGDSIIDGGNSHFSDTERRARSLELQGFAYLGLGVSGGAEGARHGPAMMAGGTVSAWKQAEPLLRAVVAQPDGRPCLEWFGAGGAGHYAKMIHNGVEYAVMQAIAEVCHALHYGDGLSWPEAADALADARQGYLVEITREILYTVDPLGDGALIDRIHDAAGQKGTGSWCVSDALELGMPVPAIAEAVAARQLSSLPLTRKRSPLRPSRPGDAMMCFAAGAVDAATAMALSQGFALALEASRQRGWCITVPAMARSWRAGSILRMPVMAELETLSPSEEFGDGPTMLNRMRDGGADDLRAFAVAALATHQPVPVLATSAAWLNSLGLHSLPTAIIQAQRDRFGDHGFRRTDREGTFHGPWNETGA